MSMTVRRIAVLGDPAGVHFSVIQLNPDFGS